MLNRKLNYNWKSKYGSSSNEITLILMMMIVRYIHTFLFKPDMFEMIFVSIIAIIHYISLLKTAKIKRTIKKEAPKWNDHFACLFSLVLSLI